MSKKYILALDQGTTSSRTVLFDDRGKICGIAQRETEQIYPKHGWVEQNAVEIYQSQLETMHTVIRERDIDWSEVVSIGITNQRETTVVWNRKTGEPIYNAIVWQDVRTSSLCKELKGDQAFDDLVDRPDQVVLSEDIRPVFTPGLAQVGLQGVQAGQVILPGQLQRRTIQGLPDPGKE